MALFSLRHSVKTFSEKRTDVSREAKLGQTGAHLRYITRPQAARVVLQMRLLDGSRYRTAAKAEDEAQRRRGRVCERFMIAFPVEATQQQREALTHAFAERLSKGVAGYVAAIHDQHGNDINNPHAHLVFFDVQQKSGGRGRPKSTLGMAKKHAIENTASMWADLHNEMMRTWGFGTESMITHQSFADRGIDRVPTIHEGASARATPHATKARKPKWQRIDQGYTRTEANRVIREINKLKREQEDAEPVRLGTSNGDDKAKRSGSFIEQRECGGWNGQAFGGDRPPFIGPCYPDESCEPVGRATKPTDSPFKSRPRPRSGSQPRFPPLGLLGVAHPVRRRRGIRRIYRELIMLRDRLRVRRLPYERQRSLYAEDTVQEMQQRPPITPLLAETKKLHRDGADRF